MADTEYSYTIKTTCAYNVCEPERLKVVDIPGSSPPITSANLLGTRCDCDPQDPGDTGKVYIRFDDPLSGGDETQLGVVVAAHDGRTQTKNINTESAAIATSDKVLLQGPDPLDESVALDRDGSSRMLFADSENTTPVTLSQIISGIAGHHGQHENGGADEISVTGLSGTLADPQTPSAHKTSHEDEGADEINVAGLSGVLADRQDANKIQGRDVLDAAPSKWDILEWDSGDSRWEPKFNPGSWQQYAYTEDELQTTSGDPQDAQSITTPSDLPTCNLQIICSILAYTSGASCEMGLRLIRDTTVICEMVPIQAVGATVRIIATRIGVDPSISGEHTYKVQYWKESGAGTAKVSHRFLAVKRFS